MLAPRRRLLGLSALFALLLAAALVSLRLRRASPPAPPETPSAPLPVSAAPEPPAPRSWPTPFSVEVKALPPPEALPPGTLRVLVVGDSVASFLGLALRYRQDEAKAFVAARGVGSCNIFESKPYIENGEQKMSSSCSMSWATDVAELRPDVTLIVMGGGFFNETSCTSAFRARYEARLLELSRAMGSNAGRVALARVPYPIKAWRHSDVMARVDCFNAMLLEAAKACHFEVLDLMSYVCPTPACNVESQGKPIRPDGLHFDGGGAEDTARWVLSELRRIHRSAPGP